MKNIKFGLLILSLVWVSCGELPTKGDYQNPFDPQNPRTAGDPFQLKAVLDRGGVTLTWNAVTAAAVTRYALYRRVDAASDFVCLATTGKDTTTWLDRNITNGHAYWYQVTAISREGEESSRTNVAAVAIHTQPVLSINGQAIYTATRQVNLTILATSATHLKLGHDYALSNASWENFMTQKNWQLLPGTGAKIIFLKVRYADSSESPTVADTIAPLPMNPDFQINHGAATTSSRNVTITCQAAGQNLSIQISEDSTFKNVSWQPLALEFGFQLTTGPKIKTVFMKFQNDFQIESAILEQQITPVKINSAQVTINAGKGYTSSREVQLNLEASGALFMQVSEDSTFSGSAWEKFLSPKNFQISAGEGPKIIYAIFNNDFDLISPRFSTQTVLDLTPPQAVFSVTPDSGITHETDFVVDATASQDNLTPTAALELRWDWDQDGQFEVDWNQARRTTWRYGQSGLKNMMLQVRDGAGWIATQKTTVFVNARPVANFSLTPRLGEVTTPFTFDASAAYDPDQESLQCRWDFTSDGNWDTDWSSQKIVSHTYQAGGNYRVTLQVRDAHGLTAKIQKYALVFINSEMVYVPAGDFRMGSATGIGDLDEEPIHSLYLAAFDIDKYEVTNAQYAQFLAAGNDAHYQPNMKIHPDSAGYFLPISGWESHPVTWVSYENALAFARWRGKSLPTEAQWEKVATGVEKRVYPWGNGLEINNANYWKNGDPFEMDFDPPTSPVGYFNGQYRLGYQTLDSPSPYGAYDLAGNVREWCLDWYQADYYQLFMPANPVGPAQGTYRVVRGGSYADEAYYLRGSARSHQHPLQANATTGFRCVK